MRQTIGCFSVCSIIAVCLLASFCGLWLPLNLSVIENRLAFCAAPYCPLVTWVTGIAAIALGVSGFLFALWRNSIKGKTSSIEEALLGGFALARYIVGGLQGLMVPAIILLFFLGMNSIAQVVLVVFLISLFGQALISAGLFAVAPSKEAAQDVIDTISG